MQVPKGVKTKRIKPKRLQDRNHLEWVASKGCSVPGCSNPSGPPHHLIGNYGVNGPVRGWGMRAGDNFAIGLCVVHHDELHADGNEKRVMGRWGLDGMVEAAKNWDKSHG